MDWDPGFGGDIVDDPGIASEAIFPEDECLGTKLDPFGVVGTIGKGGSGAFFVIDGGGG